METENPESREASEPKRLTAEQQQVVEDNIGLLGFHATQCARIDRRGRHKSVRKLDQGHYANDPSIDFDDIRQESFLAGCEGVLTFDPSRAKAEVGVAHFVSLRTKSRLHNFIDERIRHNLHLVRSKDSSQNDVSASAIDDCDAVDVEDTQTTIIDFAYAAIGKMVGIGREKKQSYIKTVSLLSQGFSCPQIAKEQGITNAGVAERLNRIRESLLKHYGAELAELYGTGRITPSRRGNGRQGLASKKAHS